MLAYVHKQDPELIVEAMASSTSSSSSAGPANEQARPRKSGSNCCFSYRNRKEKPEALLIPFRIVLR